MSKEAVDELIAILRGEEPPSEDEMKNSLVNEGKELAGRLREYGLNWPYTRVSSGKYASEVMVVDTSGFCIDSELVPTEVPLAEIPLSDLERLIKHGKRRLSKVERDIDKALMKFSSETLEGRMEGKNNKEILEMIALDRMKDLTAHFEFLRSAPTSINFHDHYVSNIFDLSLYARPPFVSMENERLSKARNRIPTTAKFLLEFEKIDQSIAERASELKLTLEQWIKNII